MFGAQSGAALTNFPSNFLVDGYAFAPRNYEGSKSRIEDRFGNNMLGFSLDAHRLPFTNVDTPIGSTEMRSGSRLQPEFLKSKVEGQELEVLKDVTVEHE